MIWYQWIRLGEPDNFVKNRLKEKTVNFHKPLGTVKTKIFTSLKRTTIKGKNQITIKEQRNLFGQLLVLSQEHSVDLQKVLQYPLTPTLWYLASPDGLFLKTNKAAPLHWLALLASLNTDDYSKNRYTTHNVDGNAL